MDEIASLLIETPTHGRVLVREPPGQTRAGLLVGFHGYAETAEIQLARLEAIPGAEAWMLLSVQALHRFYRGRSDEVVASWMTRQDREAAIADNVRYVDTAIATAIAGSCGGNDERLVFTGFSQGVPMAFRAALLGRLPCAGVIAVGGEIPPELEADPSRRFPPVLIVRGTSDEWYTEARFDTDIHGLTSRGVQVRPVTFDGGHEWGDAAGQAAGAFLLALQRV